MLFLRKGLVAAQVALSFLLLFGAGLFTRSLQNLRGTDTGVREPRTSSRSRSTRALNGYEDARGTNSRTSSSSASRRFPASARSAPRRSPILAGNESDSTMSVEGHKSANGEDMQAFMNALTPGYFKAMNVPVLAGRDFRLTDQDFKWSDKPDETGPRVAIVNRRFAEHFFKTVNGLN